MKLVTIRVKRAAIGTIPIVLVALMMSSLMASSVQMNGHQIYQVMAKMQKTEGHEDNRVLATQNTSPTPVSNAYGTTAPSTISQDGGGEVDAQLILNGYTARLSNNIAGTKAYYNIVFVTTTSGAIKSVVTSFPGGTGVPTSAFLNDVEGLGPGTVTKSGNVLRYTVSDSTPPVIPAGTKIRLEYANIINPQTPGDYVVTGSTRNVNNGFIDGPDPSAPYTIKAQIASVIQQAGSTVSASPNVFSTARATCPAGTTVVGGGYFINSGGANILKLSAEGKSGNGWLVEVFNHDAVARSFHARAECMPLSSLS